MIKNPDGSPYRVTGCLQQYDPSDPDIALFNTWDADAIRIGGSPLYYYEVFISMATIDTLYSEDRSKIWSPYPVQLYCFYEPAPSTNTLGAFGIDAPDEAVFSLNYAEVLSILGHPPKIGARVFTPMLGENWVIVQRNTGEYKMWNVLRLELICQRFQESITTGEGQVTQPKYVPPIDNV